MGFNSGFKGLITTSITTLGYAPFRHMYGKEVRHPTGKRGLLSLRYFFAWTEQ